MLIVFTALHQNVLEFKQKPIQYSANMALIFESVLTVITS